MSRQTPENDSFVPAADYADTRLKISVRNRRVRLDGTILPLPDREFDVLATLAANEGHVISRSALLTKLWGFPPELRSRTLDVHVHRLRNRLKDVEGVHLETIFKIGYRFNRLGDVVDTDTPQAPAPSDVNNTGGPMAKPMGAAATQNMAPAPSMAVAV